MVEEVKLRNPSEKDVRFCEFQHNNFFQWSFGWSAGLLGIVKFRGPIQESDIASWASE